MTPDDSPLRVLHLRSSCGLYGAEGVIQTLVHADNLDSVVVCFEDSREPHTELCAAVKSEGRTTAVLPTHGSVDPFVVLRFAAILRRFRPAVIHCHDYKSASVAVLAGAKRLVFTMHGDLRETVGSSALLRLGQWALRRFDAVVGVSEATAADAAEYGVEAARVHLIRNAVDTQRFRPPPDHAAARAALGLPADGFLVGAVGRLSEEKGHAVLLKALSKVGTPWRLALAGDGLLYAQLCKQAAELGIAGHVHFLGRIERVERVYHALDALAQPSHREGLPLTVVEAAACGLPVVATDVGDVSHVIRDGVTGLLVPPGDAAAMASALAKLAEAPGLRASLGEAARNHAVASFGAPVMVAAYEALYRQVVRR